MKTFKIPVVFYVKAHSPESAEATLLGALGYLEDNCALRCFSQLEYNTDERNPEAVAFDWRRKEEVIQFAPKGSGFKKAVKGGAA